MNQSKKLDAKGKANVYAFPFVCFTQNTSLPKFDIYININT